MLLIALITAGLVSTAHTGSAPAVSAAGPNAPSIVFDRPAPAPAKSEPIKAAPRPLPPDVRKAKPAAAAPLAHGVPLVVAPFACYEYIVNPALDPKDQAIVNPVMLQPACIKTSPGAPIQP